ncbi:MAG: DUF1538 domain-containing protein [Pseudomonadota bacterium]
MSTQGPNATDNPRFKLGLRDTLRILRPYLKRNFTKQLQGIWFIVTYLVVFQWLVLKLPLVFALMIATGIFIVAVGLMFFMEGLRLGLMPLGETIGSILPRNSNMVVILLFAFLLGIGATLAEPAIAVLKAAGSGIAPSEQPLLYSLLNDYSGQLVASVGVGVGIAVVLGVLRFFYGWQLKYMAMPVVAALLGVSVYFSQIPLLNDVLGLAWDCGAVTTGPVTVPLVLALGIGVCRVVSSGSGGAGHSGFGIVTLASLFPILAVLLLALFHYVNEDYYGGINYRADNASLQTQATGLEDGAAGGASDWVKRHSVQYDPISTAEHEQYLATGRILDNYEIDFGGSTSVLEDGQIIINQPKLVLKKRYVRDFEFTADELWNTEQSTWDAAAEAIIGAFRAIIPLCLFFYFVLRFVLKHRLERATDVLLGIGFALGGMALFSLGITLGLMPLGTQLGSNIPLAFAQIVPWGLGHLEGPLFGAEHSGKLVAVGFAFLLGYGATLAEPALNALGDTVERITVGAFPRRLLMQSVAVGVGLGIGAGVVKMAYGLALVHMLVPPYLLVLLLTVRAPHEFVNFAWDSAGVTTGPITVPLVLAMGLGIGANVVGVSDGFGILALASVGPILTVLSVGLYTKRRERRAEAPSKNEITSSLTNQPSVTE